MAHKTKAIIDEFDKMDREDRNHMHEAMEQQTITVNKGNVHGQLRCECGILAAANPKNGRFDPHTLLIKQIELPSTIISRFDLLFPVVDKPDRDQDYQMARNVGQTYVNPKEADEKYDLNKLRKYIGHATTFKPMLSDEAVHHIAQFFAEMKSRYVGEDGAGPVAIAGRQLEVLFRLAEAYAKLRFSKSVNKGDAQKACSMIKSRLEEVAFDQTSGAIDSDIIATGISSSKRGQYRELQIILDTLERQTGSVLSIRKILQMADAKGISEDVVMECLDDMKNKGDIAEPKSGFYTRT